MKKVILLFFFFFLCVACEKNGKLSTTSEVIKPVEVEIKINPETIYVNEEIELEAIVTQNGKGVDDANEVMFEIRQSEQAKHEMKEATHDKDGRYKIKTVFSVAGTYDITAHTTARDMHVMPTIEVTVKGK